MLWKETFLSEAQMSPWLFLYSGWENLDKSAVPGDGQKLRHLGGEFVHVMVGGGISLSLPVCCPFHPLCTISHHLSFHDVFSVDVIRWW